MTRPTPMLDAALLAGRTRVIQNACTPVYGSCALLAGHDGKHHGYKRNIAQLVDLAGREVLRAALPWTPPPEVIEAMAKEMATVFHPTEAGWAYCDQNFWKAQALSGYRAHPLVLELWQEER